MAFFTVNKKQEGDGYGRLYVFRFQLDCGTDVWKVGMCNSSRSTDRFMEVCLGFFTQYRYIPRCSIRRDKAVVAPRLVEKHLHGLLEEYSYRFDKKFSGSTEFFIDLDEKVLLDYIDNFDYRELLKGTTEMRTVDYEAIVKELNTMVVKKGSDNLNF